jgi:hypothetical protein
MKPRSIRKIRMPAPERCKVGSTSHCQIADGLRLEGAIEPQVLAGGKMLITYRLPDTKEKSVLWKFTHPIDETLLEGSGAFDNGDPLWQEGEVIPIPPPVSSAKIQKRKLRNDAGKQRTPKEKPQDGTPRRQRPRRRYHPLVKREKVSA